MSLSPKLLVLTGLVVASMVFLMARTIGGQSGVYYVELREFLEKPLPQSVRVAGWVADGTIQKEPGGLTVKFTMCDQDGKLALPVVFDARGSGGRIPDTFTDGSQVVVSGKLEDGVFQANQMLAKCPSKYEAAKTAGQTN